MTLSARNQLAGKVIDIEEGAVNGVVKVQVGENKVSATITMEAIKELGLEKDKDVKAVIKATHVLFATGNEPLAISARNQLPGEIAELNKGAVNSSVALKLKDGQLVKGNITNEAVDELGLEVGKPALAIIKASNVMIAI